MIFEYTFDYNQHFYHEIGNLLKQFDIEIEESLSLEHMYALKEFLSNNIVIFNLNKKSGSIDIEYHNPSNNNNFWNEPIVPLILKELQKIIRINHMIVSNKNILRKSIERCIVS
jgi:hypothetical protein